VPSFRICSTQLLSIAASMVAAGAFATNAIAQQYPAAQPRYPQQQAPYPQQPGQYPQAGQYPQQAPPPYSGPAPVFAPEQLDSLVSQVALYPDPLLAQVLTSATYPDQIQQAAGWANDHRNLSGEMLARAINDDRLPWDPSVIALLPFPTVLDTMARDMNWTQQLGSAVLAQRPEVMDSVQRMRQRAMDYGYLRDTPQERVVVAGPRMIQIMPVDPGYYYVPVYNPSIVFARPSRGVSFGISFGPRVAIGSAFTPWGWGSPGLDWRARTVVIDRRPWDRRWDNRDRYVHPYAVAPQRREGPRVERHEERRNTDRRDDRRNDNSRDRDDRRRDRDRR
jgi:hypothetical protein